MEIKIPLSQGNNMKIKKICSYFFIGFSICYTLYMGASFLSHFIIEHIYYKPATFLNDTLYLETKKGTVPFNRKKDDIYCTFDEVCAKVKNITENGFQLQIQNETHLYKKHPEKENTFSQEMYIPLINNQPLKKKITFLYQEDSKISTIECRASEVCKKGEKELPFSFVVSGLKVDKNKDFNDNIPINESDKILLKEGDKFYTLTKNNQGIFKKDETQMQIHQNRFLLAVSSFKRPIYLVGLVHRLFNQTYQNFDVSISLKGVDTQTLHHLIKPELNSLQKGNRLILKEHKNENQLTNLINTFRELDLKNYDYICKIDDDDFYSNNYLNSVNMALNLLENPEFLFKNNFDILYENTYSTYLINSFNQNPGATTCFSTQFVPMLFELEKMTPTQLKNLIKSDEKNDLSLYEDWLFHKVSHQQGKKHIYFSLEPLFIYNKTNTSITRFQ